MPTSVQRLIIKFWPATVLAVIVVSPLIIKKWADERKGK